ncbi:hypothetical protein BST61_g2462 [Cercospora zeina]
MIFGRTGPKATAAILLSLTVALNAGLTSCDNTTPGCADYIRAGLGYDGPVQIIQTDYEYYTTTEHVTVTAGPPPPPPSQELAAASACSNSWSSYRSRSSANVVWKYVTTTMYEVLTTSLTYGRGDVYSTEPAYKIPVAHGNFTPTSTAQRVLNITSTVKWATQSTRNQNLTKATPTCDLLKPKECSKLYVDYISSLGLPYNASVPKVTPAPTNSPPCPDYFYKPFSTCQKSFVTSYANDCTIMGNSVKLFYFPTQSTTPTQDPSATITKPPEVIYEYAPGTTFTSPSIYLKFDYLSAERVVNADDAIYCTECDQTGCTTSGVDGGQSRKVEGTSIAGQLISLAPQEVSSIVLDFHEQEASSIIRTMAHNLPGYADVMARVIGNYNVTAKRLNLSDIIHPPPEAYYLQPLDNAPGCDVAAPQPECSTIFEGAYRALISLPQEVTGIQGAWKSCFPVIYGVYDPPIALTEASVADGPTLPGGGGYKPTQGPEQTGQTPQTPLPGHMPQIPPIARPTALPDNLPAEGSVAGPTLPHSGGSWGGNGGSENTGDSGNDGGGSDGGGSGNNGGGSDGGGSGKNGGGSDGGGSGNNGGGSSNGESGNNGGGSSNGESGNNGGGSSNGESGNNGGGSSNGESGNNGGGSSNGASGGSGPSGSDGAENNGESSPFSEPSLSGDSSNNGDSASGESANDGGPSSNGGSSGNGGFSNNGGSATGDGGSTDGEGGGSSNNHDQSSGSGYGGANGSGGNGQGGGEGSGNNSGSSSGGNGQGPSGENTNSSGGSSNSDNDDSSNDSGNGSSGSSSNGSGSSNGTSSGHNGKHSLASASIQSVGIHLIAFYTCTVILLAEILAP